MPSVEIDVARRPPLPSAEHAPRRCGARSRTTCGSITSVAVVGDEVVLSGVVPSWRVRAAIEGAVRGTAGVRSVRSDLRVQP